MAKKNKKNRRGIVFSTDPDFEYAYREAEEQETPPPQRQKLRVLLDRKRRRGKEATLVTGFTGTEEDLKARFREGNSTLRLLNYPVRPRDSHIVEEMPEERRTGEDPPLSTGRHTDAAGVSILWQREAGLQAQAPDGTWRDVPRIENCLSVHLGTVLEIMTEGRVPATPHRVIDRGAPRQSIGFFLEPGLGAQLEPIKAGAAASASVTGTYGWHLQERFHEQKGYEHLVPRPKLATGKSL